MLAALIPINNFLQHTGLKQRLTDSRRDLQKPKSILMTISLVILS